jgi:asparagine synthase (glutamine-hydrolysing)
VTVYPNNPFKFDFRGNHFVPTPGSRWDLSTTEERLTEHMLSCGSRVVLSGIGGDEVTGGVPVPIPELADLLATAQFKTLAHQLRLWALNKRRPWFHLLLETAQAFFPLSLVRTPKEKRPASWLCQDFAIRQKAALLGYEVRTKLFGPLPSFQENIATLNALRRQLACDALPLCLPYEKRYPFVDRDLLEFLFAIPREQLVRPGQRRSLMRRALAGIVPDELLNRRRKAFVDRSPRTAIASTSADLARTNREMVNASIGIADPGRLFDAVSRADQDQEIPIITLARTLALEAWLRGLRSLPAQFRMRSANAPSGNQSFPEGTGSFTQRDSVRMD